MHKSNPFLTRRVILKCIGYATKRKRTVQGLSSLCPNSHRSGLCRKRRLHRIEPLTNFRSSGRQRIAGLKIDGNPAQERNDRNPDARRARKAHTDKKTKGWIIDATE